MDQYIAQLIAEVQARLEKARQIAAPLRFDPSAHRTLLDGIFALEDMLFALHQIAAAQTKQN